MHYGKVVYIRSLFIRSLHFVLGFVLKNQCWSDIETQCIQIILLSECHVLYNHGNFLTLFEEFLSLMLPHRVK